MKSATFYPVGHGDAALLEFSDGRMMLVDYCQRHDPDDDTDKRIDLAGELRALLAERGKNSIDVVVFTHADSDHVDGAEEFFWLEHAEKYQDDDRVGMTEMWVPANSITETGTKGTAKVLRAEARHRLKAKSGIRVFSAPGALDEWLADAGIAPDEVTSLVSHAGSLVPCFDRDRGGAEIFVHSPFSFRTENEEDRNNASIVLHVTAFVDGEESRLLLGADAKHQAWGDIVAKTTAKNRTGRLKWDCFAIAHHCSFTALSDDKGAGKTEPTEAVAPLYGYAQKDAIIVSSSDIIPSEDTEQPPHRQTAAYYRDVVGEDQFFVTMEYPKPSAPKPLVVQFTKHGPRVGKTAAVPAGAAVLSAVSSPRHG